MADFIWYEYNGTAQVIYQENELTNGNTYLEESIRLQPKAMFIDNRYIFHNSNFVLSHNSLHFSAHQF